MRLFFIPGQFFFSGPGQAMGARGIDSMQLLKFAGKAQ
jgi:hypothetical protein